MISHKQSRMDGFILILSVVAMAYRNQADLPMTSCAPVLRKRGITRPPQHLVSGAISGNPFNLSYCSMDIWCPRSEERRKPGRWRFFLGQSMPDFGETGLDIVVGTIGLE